MGDCWDDEPSTNEPVGNSYSNAPVGRSFGKGRGFVPREPDASNTWGQNSYDGNRRGGRGGYRDGRSNYGNRDDETNGNRGGYRGRSSNYESDGGKRGGGGGYRGGRSNYNSNQNGENETESDRREGYRGGGTKNYNHHDNKSGGDYEDDNAGKREYRPRGGDSGRGGGDRGGGRGGSRGNGSRDNYNDGENGGEEGEKPRPPPYIPADLPDDEDALFQSGIQTGNNFKDYDNIPVKASGENVPPPMSSFANSGLRDSLLRNVTKCRYTIPTPIQKYSIPCILAGRDVMATAQTGSGKTAAFTLPILNKLLEDKSELIFDETHCEPHVLIVSPTRELTIQIHEVITKFAHGMYLKVALLYGGTAPWHQRNQVLKGAHVIVATPGRLNDFVNRGTITFSSIKFVVLDEADRMLELGFAPDVEKVMNHPTMVKLGKRQTLMFSATFSEEIQRLAAAYLHDYIFLAVGIVGGACKDVEQVFYETPRREKRSKLISLLEQEGDNGTLVFIETKKNADFIAAFLSERDFPTTSIHGDRFQKQREEALSDFKSQRMHVLVATAVAARGLDIGGVKHVINYDLPSDITEYVHRIGRTGRLGNYGKASSFFDSSSDNDVKLAPDLIKILSQAGQTVPGWLAQCSDGVRGNYEHNPFGGEDIRGPSVRTASYDSRPPPVQEEESWD